MVLLPTKEHKVNRVTKGLAVFAALLALVAVPTAGAATVPPLPSPATVLTLSPFSYPGGITNQLQGSLCQTPRTCVPVNWPIFVPLGVPELDTAINSTSGKIIVFGYSEGAQVAEQWVIQHANDPNAPSSANLTFVAIGNSTRAYGGSLNMGGFSEVWPQSQYPVIDIARQYDYAADFPNNSSSPYFLLAVVNALVGGFNTHDYKGVNINDPANTVWTVGNITYVLVPTQNLPLVDPLRGLGLTALADQLQAQLKPLVDQAYNRNYPGLSASVASDPTVAPQDATVSVSLAPAPAADLAPTATRPKQANGNGKVLPVADTLTTTPPPDTAEVLNTVKTITPPTGQPELDNAMAPTQFTTAPTTRTTATSTTRGNEVEPGKSSENQATTKGGDQATSTKDSATSTTDSATSTTDSATSTKDSKKAADSNG
jgi:hypothetical protein